MSRAAPGLSGAARSMKGATGKHPAEPASLISPGEVTEIELHILRRLREMAIGDHRGLTHGSGFDYVGNRDWQGGDRLSTIDWAQSSLTNFSPLIVRDFEQPSTAAVVAVADASLSTRCGIGGVPVAKAIAHALATIGMSAVFFQDAFGLITFDGDVRHLAALQPRVGRNQVLHCLSAYQGGEGLQDLKSGHSVSTTLASFLRKTTLVPFISDFLFDSAESLVEELSVLNTTHDVFIVLVDAAFAFSMPEITAGWIDVVDIETGHHRMISRRALSGMAERIREWQNGIERLAAEHDLDIVRVDDDAAARDRALAEFVAARRLRKVS